VGVEKLLEAITALVSNVPPDKIPKLADLIRGATGPKDSAAVKAWPLTPTARERLEELLQCWDESAIPPAELAGVIIGASYAYHSAKTEQELELVWTGPSSELVATRKTEQALLQVINAAKVKFFLTSFVAYDVDAVKKAILAAADRGVDVSMLLESSDRHGGGISFDVIGSMRKAIPSAKIYFWNDKEEAFAGGKVHAKVAVCDENLCFISSANLTGHAMEKNMEAGVLIKGGALPRKLHNHLDALVTIKKLKM